MNQPDTKRNIIILVGIIALGIAAYFFLIREDGIPTDTISPEDAQASAEVEEVLGLLQELQVINIDPRAVDNLNATAFRNFHLEIVPGPRGKANPFTQ